MNIHCPVATDRDGSRERRYSGHAMNKSRYKYQIYLLVVSLKHYSDPSPPTWFPGLSISPARSFRVGQEGCASSSSGGSTQVGRGVHLATDTELDSQEGLRCIVDSGASNRKSTTQTPVFPSFLDQVRAESPGGGSPGVTRTSHRTKAETTSLKDIVHQLKESG